MANRLMFDTLLDTCESHAEDIANLWYEALIKNPRTSSYRSLPRDRVVAQAISLYQNLKKLYLAEDLSREVVQLFERIQYVRDTRAKDIPLPEAIYALILMRRHIWLYAESQALFHTTPMAIYEQTRSINRTLLLFDYAIYLVAKKYHDTDLLA